MKSSDENTGPFDYRPHQSPDAEEVLKEPYLSNKDNLIEDLVIDFEKVWTKSGDDMKTWLRQTLSDLYTKTEAAGREETIKLKSAIWDPHEDGYIEGKKERRAEFARELMRKMNILLANYSDDRRVPPAEIRKLLESEIKVL